MDAITPDDSENLAQNKKADNTYEKRIIESMRQLKIQGDKYLSKEGLAIYSPKFLLILDMIEKQRGLHLIYSQFRTFRRHWYSKTYFRSQWLRRI